MKYLILFLLTAHMVSAQSNNSAKTEAKPISIKKKVVESKAEDKSSQKIEVISSATNSSAIKAFPSRKKADIDWVNPNTSTAIVSGGMIEISLKISTPDKINP